MCPRPNCREGAKSVFLFLCICVCMICRLLVYYSICCKSVILLDNSCFSFYSIRRNIFLFYSVFGRLLIFGFSHLFHFPFLFYYWPLGPLVVVHANQVPAHIAHVNGGLTCRVFYWRSRETRGAVRRCHTAAHLDELTGRSDGEQSPAADDRWQTHHRADSLRQTLQ